MAIGGEGDLAGKLRHPLPDWEEWSWNFKAYISMFETGAVMNICPLKALRKPALGSPLAAGP